MENMFQCSVCQDMPACKIYQCRSGHLMCHDCHNKIQRPIKCPVCRDPMPATPIRNLAAEEAIRNLGDPCKFSSDGCKLVGARTIMKEHEDRCLYRKIQCELCDKTPTFAGVVNHMKFLHYGTILNNTEGKFSRNFWSEEYALFLDEPDSNWDWVPVMTEFDGYDFLTNSAVIDNSWSLCVVIIGEKKQAQQYEISMSIRGDAAAVSVRGEVHSIDVAMGEILDGKGEGVLQFNKNMASKLSRVTADGRQGIRVVYELRRK